MRVEEIESVEYERFFDDTLNVTHAFQKSPLDLAHPVIPDSDMTEVEKTRWINNQIERRKRMMAQLHLDIESFRELRDEV